MDQKLKDCSKPSTVRKNPCLKSTIDKLYAAREKTGDIEFVVDGEVVPAHRCVLAALSPKYEAQFYGAMAEKDTIHVEDVSPGAFKEFLQFFYTENVTLTLDNIEDVLNLAKQSLVDELVAECINYLIDLVGLDKIVWCYRLALDYDIKSVEKFCVKHIGMNIKSLFNMDDFLSCERDVLCRVLDFNSMNCKEIDVFDGCIAWARAKCERDETDATVTANLRLALGEALFKIRFCSMNVEEFATISQQYDGLLSAQELVEVFQAIALKENGIHSGTFSANNSMPRKPVQTIREYSLTNGSRLPLKANVNICFIEFSTDKVIELNGLTLGIGIDDDIGVVSKLPENELDKPKNTKTTSENETKIIIDQPIQIKANESFVLSVESEAFKKSNLYGFDLEEQTTQNGVSFAITCGTVPNSIERLLFTIVDDL